MTDTPADDTKTYDVTIAGTADGGDRIPDLSTREARDRWIDRLRTSKSESTVSSYHYRTKHFVEWCEANGIDPIRALTGWDIESYETYRRGGGVAPISLTKEMGTLKQFLEYCARVDLVDESIPEKVDPPDVPRDAQVDETRLEPEAARALLHYYNNDPEVRHSRAHALLALVWYTGIRLGGVRALDLDHYDSEQQYAEFHHRPEEDTPLKNGSDGERVVGLPPAVCPILDRYIKHNRHDKYDDHGRQPLLTSTQGRPSQAAVRGWMYQATIPCRHSFCPHGNDPDTCEWTEYTHASKCPSSRSPHQVRTGSITWQLNRGVPTDVVANRVNATVRTIEDHYDVPDKFEEMEKRRRPHLDRLTLEEEEDEEDEKEGGD